MSAVSLCFAYSYSSAAAYAIAEKHGGGKALLRLYSAFNSEKIKGKPGRKLTDRVLRKALKTSLQRGRERESGAPTPRAQTRRV